MYERTLLTTSPGDHFPDTPFQRMRVMVSPFLRRAAAVLFAGALVFGAAGCGGARTGDVTGTVKIRGQPPRTRGLRIGFVRGDEEAITAEVTPEGKYTAVGV